MAERDGIAPVPAIVHSSPMSLARAHELATPGPIYGLTLTGIIRGRPSLSQLWYSLEVSMGVSAHEYARAMALRDALAHHNLEMMGVLGEVSIRVVPSANSFALRADPRAWSDLLRRRSAVRVEWQGVTEVETALRVWLNKLN